MIETLARSYHEYIRSNQVAEKEILENLANTPYLTEFAQSQWEALVKNLKDANDVMDKVETEVIPELSRIFDTGNHTPDAVLFGAIQCCLDPDFAITVAKRFGIESNFPLMIAATHLGTIQMAGLAQKSEDPNETKRIESYARYFAGAQTFLLCFKTSTTVSALHPENANFSSMKKIAIVSIVENDSALEKDRLEALYNGLGVSEIKEIGKGKYFIA